MWKRFDQVYSQNLKSEIGLVFLCKNVYDVPFVENAVVSCTSKAPLSWKGVLMAGSGIQLITNCRPLGELVTKPKGVDGVYPGEFFGSKVFISRRTVWQFMHFLTSLQMPLFDSTNLISLNKKGVSFSFSLNTPSVFTRLAPFLQHFPFLPGVHVQLSLKTPPQKNISFFWRFLKLPIGIVEK
jgi:ribosomal protein L5